MRGSVPSYQMITPRTLNEALAYLADQPGEWRPFAGGTDLMVQLEAGVLEHRKYLNLSKFDVLRGIQDGDAVTIGALTSFSEIHGHPVLQDEFSVLVQAAQSVGAIAIQNRATLGGNVANGSPAADSPPALLVYDAQIRLISKSGERIVPYRDFHLGYKKMALRPDELIHSVVLPKLEKTSRKSKWNHYFRKVGARKAQAISKVCMAGLLEHEGDQILDLRISLGSVAPTVLRCIKTEKILHGQKLSLKRIGEAKQALREELSPISDIRSTSEYRFTVALNLLEEFLDSCKA